MSLDEARPKFHLCSRCSKIDFEALFSNPPALSQSGGVLVVELGSLKTPRFWFQRKCNLCAFFRSTLEEHSQNGRYELRAINSARVLTRTDPLPEQNLPETVEKASTVLQILRSDTNEYLRQFMDPISLDVNSSPKILMTASNHLLMPVDLEITGQKLNTNDLPFQAFSHLIEQCQLSHVDCQRHLRDSRETFVPGLRVIDCLTREIVLYNTNHKYLALSYVWGDRSEEQRQDQKTEPLAKAPQTVVDAIKVTKDLGFRYLWVDAFCIDDTSAAVRTQQIARMDGIYERAEITLVALGRNAQAGLPGVSRPRRAQPFIQFSYGTLVSSLTDLRGMLLDSPWLTRAWTYQEGLLAQRCLFFTDQQAYFACRSLIKGETMNYVRYPNKLVLGPELFNFNQEIHLEDDIKAMQNSEDELFKSHIMNYTTREWTYPSDSLNAFLGIISRSTVNSLHGVPLLKTYSCEQSSFIHGVVHSVARGLLWYSYQSHAIYGIADLEGLVSDHPNARSPRPSDQLLLADVESRVDRYKSPSWSWTCFPHGVEFNSHVQPSIAGSSVRHSLDLQQIEVQTIDGFWFSVQDELSLTRQHPRLKRLRLRCWVWDSLFTYKWSPSDQLYVHIDLFDITDDDDNATQSGGSTCTICPCISRTEWHQLGALLLCLEEQNDRVKVHWLLVRCNNHNKYRVGTVECTIPSAILSQHVHLRTVVLS